MLNKDEIIREIRDHAKKPCPQCGGYGVVNLGRSMTAISESEHGCPACSYGLVDNPEILQIADRLEELLCAAL